MSHPSHISNEELWEFPHDFPLSVMGRASDPMRDIVADIVQRHVPGFDAGSLTLHASSKGTWVSVRGLVRINTKEQINGIYAELAADSRIRMAL